MSEIDFWSNYHKDVNVFYIRQRAKLENWSSSKKKLEKFLSMYKMPEDEFSNQHGIHLTRKTLMHFVKVIDDVKFMN